MIAHYNGYFTPKNFIFGVTSLVNLLYQVGNGRCTCNLRNTLSIGLFNLTEFKRTSMKLEPFIQRVYTVRALHVKLHGSSFNKGSHQV